MTELGDDFREWNKQKQAKRQNNAVSSTKLLNEFNVNYESKNGGVHLIISHENSKIDFWPTTGLWSTRKGKKGRGVFRLLDFLGIEFRCG